MSGRWVSVEEIAEYLGVSKDTVYGWIALWVDREEKYAGPQSWEALEVQDRGSRWLGEARKGI